MTCHRRSTRGERPRSSPCAAGSPAAGWRRSPPRCGPGAGWHPAGPATPRGRAQSSDPATSSSSSCRTPAVTSTATPSGRCSASTAPRYDWSHSPTAVGSSTTAGCPTPGRSRRVPNAWPSSASGSPTTPGRSPPPGSGVGMPGCSCRTSGGRPRSAPAARCSSRGEGIRGHRQRGNAGWVSGAELARGVSTVTTRFARPVTTVAVVLDDPNAFGDVQTGRDLVLALSGAVRATDAQGRNLPPTVLTGELRSVLVYDVVPEPQRRRGCGHGDGGERGGLVAGRRAGSRRAVRGRGGQRDHHPRPRRRDQPGGPRRPRVDSTRMAWSSRAGPDQTRSALMPPKTGHFILRSNVLPPVTAGVVRARRRADRDAVHRQHRTHQREGQLPALHDAARPDPVELPAGQRRGRVR